MVIKRVKTKTIVKDRGLKKIKKELDKLKKKPIVKIGYPAESQKKDQEHEGGEFVTVLDIAIFHEFGTIMLDERSFIRKSFDKNRKKYLRLRKKLMVKIHEGRLTVEKSLEIVGEIILNDIRNFLTSDSVRPRSNRAIEDNGSTLVDTGQLLGALTWKVIMNP